MTRSAQRLENLWSGAFGDAYTLRNLPDSRRGIFWKKILSLTRPLNALEVGCNRGGNLRRLAEFLPAKGVYGVDINESALAILKKECPRVNAIWSAARELPFKDAFFDLAFTAGVLIHQPPASLKKVMGEVVRVSRRWVLCLEYFAPDDVEIPYRGHRGALFKRDFGKLYQKNFPGLKLRRTGFLGKEDGWDDVTFWLFEKVKSKGKGSAG